MILHDLRYDGKVKRYGQKPTWTGEIIRGPVNQMSSSSTSSRNSLNMRVLLIKMRVILCSEIRLLSRWWHWKLSIRCNINAIFGRSFLSHCSLGFLGFVVGWYSSISCNHFFLWFFWLPDQNRLFPWSRTNSTFSSESFHMCLKVWVLFQQANFMVAEKKILSRTFDFRWHFSIDWSIDLNSWKTRLLSFLHYENNEILRDFMLATCFPWGIMLWVLINHSALWIDRRGSISS